MFANIFYYFLRGYTYVMHYFNKWTSFLKIQSFLKKDKLELIIDNNSQEIYKNELVLVSPIQFDFIQYTNDNNISIYFIVPTINNLIIQKQCSYKFISISIRILELNFIGNIEFKGYYIIGNKINLDIIYYLLKLQHNIEIIGKDVNKKYILTIIDQDVKIINIDETKIITFHLNNYTIT